MPGSYVGIHLEDWVVQLVGGVFQLGSLMCMLLKMTGDSVVIGDHDIVQDKVAADVDNIIRLRCADGCPFCCSGYYSKKTIEEEGLILLDCAGIYVW